MKHKNILLVVFFLTMFVFQQVQAEANLPTTGKPSQMNSPLANTYLFDTVYVQIYPLDNAGKIIQGHSACDLSNTSDPLCPDIDPPTYCVDNASKIERTNGYNFYYLCTDQDYLPDVVAEEMDVMAGDRLCLRWHLKHLDLDAFGNRVFDRV